MFSIRVRQIGNNIMPSRTSVTLTECVWWHGRTCRSSRVTPVTCSYVSHLIFIHELSWLRIWKILFRSRVPSDDDPNALSREHHQQASRVFTAVQTVGKSKPSSDHDSDHLKTAATEAKISLFLALSQLSTIVAFEIQVIQQSFVINPSLPLLPYSTWFIEISYS